jgi:hypothetical protein
VAGIPVFDPPSADGFAQRHEGKQRAQKFSKQLSFAPFVILLIIVPKTEISPEYGFMAVFIDSEGNRIGLHSVPA